MNYQQFKASVNEERYQTWERNQPGYWTHQILVLGVLLALVFFCSGCRGFNRLVGGPESGSPAPTTAISSNQFPTKAPDFGLPTPAGMQKSIFFGAMPNDGLVQAQADSNAVVAVFIYQQGVNNWFQLKNTYSAAFWYSFDPASGTVQYQGQHLPGTAYCVYEYRP